MLRRLKRTIDTLRRPAYLFDFTEAGFVFPSLWFCNLCHKSVMRGQMLFHAKQSHGFKGENVRIESPAS